MRARPDHGTRRNGRHDQKLRTHAARPFRGEQDVAARQDCRARPLLHVGRGVHVCEHVLCVDYEEDLEVARRVHAIGAGGGGAWVQNAGVTQRQRVQARGSSWPGQCRQRRQRPAAIRAAPMARPLGCSDDSGARRAPHTSIARFGRRAARPAYIVVREHPRGEDALHLKPF